MLLTVGISRGSGSSGAERLGTVLRRLVSCPRGRSFDPWIRAAISWPKSMQEPQHGQYRTVLGRCCNCSPDHSFPASHRELGSGLNMRSKLKFVPLFIVAALACLIFWYFWGSPPSGQPPLTSLSPNNLDQFRREFNGAVDRSRMVLLLSPT